MPDQTRVLIVITSDRRRGAELEGLQLASELTAEGLVTDVVALAPTSGKSRVDVPLLGKTPLAWRTLRELRRRAKRVDLVIAYGSTSLPACTIALFGVSTPFVYRSIGDPMAWVRSDWHRRRTAFLIRRAKRVVALWPGAADAISDQYGVSPHRVDVIPNARSAGDFPVADQAQRMAARQTLGLPPERLAVGFVGSISAEKRIDLAIEAVAKLNGAFLVVVGDGLDRAMAENLGAACLGERIVFTGVLESVTQAYAAMDVLLLTSATEGMPGVMIEAALSGVPVVAPDVGAIRWLFDNGVEGELVPADAPADQYSEAVARVVMATDRHVTRRLDACTWPAVVDQWIAVVQLSTRQTDTVETVA